MREPLIAVIGASMLCSCGDPFSEPAHAGVAPSLRFEEVSAPAVSRIGMSFGVSWGDVNGDGRPDLYLGNHFDQRGPSLYENLGKGVFRDMAAAWLQWTPEARGRDRHGAVFADFDNDGDQDLLIAVGATFGTGAQPNIFFLNEDGHLRECAKELGIDNPLAPGRTYLPVDLDGDGRLDVLCMARDRKGGRPMTAFFRQSSCTPLSFEQADIGLESVALDGEYVQMGYLDGRGLVFLGHGWPIKLAGMEGGSLKDLTEKVGLARNLGVKDSAWADFDNDGDLDLFCCTGTGSTGISSPDARTVHGRFITDRDVKGVRVKVGDGAGRLKVSLYCPTVQLRPEGVFIGAAASHPETMEFELDASDAAAVGLRELEPGAEDAVSVGFDPTARAWLFEATSQNPTSKQVILESSIDVVGVEPIGFEPGDDSLPDRLLRWDGARFVDASEAAGFVEPTNAESVVAGDFDNDMDVDLYVVTLGGAVNSPNVVYENLGRGRFARIADSAHAAGTAVGGGESVSAADFDGDGFLDLCVTNGQGWEPFYGPVQLFRNAGNSNHWLMIDLVGSRSNRDGIGARVRVTAGKVTQLRLQDGGVHKYGQSCARLHFGLGPYTSADRIVVDWPSGTHQELEGVAADRVLRIVEPE